MEGQVDRSVAIEGVGARADGRAVILAVEAAKAALALAAVRAIIVAHADAVPAAAHIVRCARVLIAAWARPWWLTRARTAGDGE